MGHLVVRASECVGIAAVTVLVVTVLLAVVAPNFGWRVDTVVSSNMDTELTVGSVIVTRPVEYQDIVVGDVITFRSPVDGKTTSRRVLAVEDGPSFIAGGVAGDDAYPLVVPAHDLDGRVCLDLPLFGYVLQELRKPIGLLLLFILGFAIVLSELGSMFEVRRKEPPTSGPLY